MFPFRQFLARFFPARYFAKVGSGPATVVDPSVVIRFAERSSPVVACDERSTRLPYDERSVLITFRR